MAKVAIKAKKKRSEWGDTSQETPESLEQSRAGARDGDGEEEEEEGDLPETEVAEESYAALTENGDGEQSMDIDETVRDEEHGLSMDESRVETPRRSAQMEDVRATPATELAAPNAKDEETQESVATSHAYSAPPARQLSPRAASSDADSSIPRQARPLQETPLFGPALGSSQSQSQSITGDLDESLGSQRQSMNLTDIGLLSSQADQTQIEVEPTQVEYDVERLPLISGDLSVGSELFSWSNGLTETDQNSPSSQAQHEASPACVTRRSAPTTRTLSPYRDLVVSCGESLRLQAPSTTPPAQLDRLCKPPPPTYRSHPPPSPLQLPLRPPAFAMKSSHHRPGPSSTRPHQRQLPPSSSSPLPLPLPRPSPPPTPSNLSPSLQTVSCPTAKVQRRPRRRRRSPPTPLRRPNAVSSPERCHQ